MAAITHIRSLEYAAKMMGEDLELLEATLVDGSGDVVLRPRDKRLR